ncbi:nucleotidyltransferase family protein [Paenibacillus shenyangensis]|uniref:nucleotidyltransferase family protein n=1 Tax=Paenibacillus sp. A9 TaxID=1284352 RepID=UPI00036FBC18|nr:nucleotidyltransferase family protein [Paenibacillus sp. A9]
MSIAALVLAAGKSSRMGRDKLSLPLAALAKGYTASDQTAASGQMEMLQAQQPYSYADIEDKRPDSHGKRKAAVLDSVTSIGGHVLQAVYAEKRLSPVVIVHAPHSSLAWGQEVLQWCQMKAWKQTECVDAEHGMAYSIRCGMEQIKSSSAEGVMILLADQPLIDAALLADLIDNWQQSDLALDYMAASDGRNVQPPVILARHIWDRLDQLTGDQGARKLIRQPDLQGQIISYAEHYFWDADTPDDLERIRAHITHALELE